MKTSDETRSLPRFIVGLSRAGTTWMSLSLNRHPDTAAIGETGFWARLFVEPNEQDRYGEPEAKRLMAIYETLHLDSTVGGVGEGWCQKIKRETIPDIAREVFDKVDGEGLDPGVVFDRLARAFAAYEGKTQWVEKTYNGNTHKRHHFVQGLC